MAKTFNCISSKQIPSTSSWPCPSFDSIRVWPEHITHNTFLRNLFESINSLNILHISNIRRQSSMDAKNFLVHHSSQGQIVKNLCASSPNIERSIFPDTFIIKTVYLSNQPRFVITSEESDSIFISHFQC